MKSQEYYLSTSTSEGGKCSSLQSDNHFEMKLAPSTLVCPCPQNCFSWEELWPPIHNYYR